MGTQAEFEKQMSTPRLSAVHSGDESSPFDIDEAYLSWILREEMNSDSAKGEEISNLVLQELNHDIK